MQPAALPGRRRCTVDTGLPGLSGVPQQQAPCLPCSACHALPRAACLPCSACLARRSSARSCCCPSRAPCSELLWDPQRRNQHQSTGGTASCCGSWPSEWRLRSRVAPNQISVAMSVMPTMYRLWTDWRREDWRPAVAGSCVGERCSALRCARSEETTGHTLPASALVHPCSLAAGHDPLHRSSALPKWRPWLETLV